jgi:hypothetical protein
MHKTPRSSVKKDESKNDIKYGRLVCRDFFTQGDYLKELATKIEKHKRLKK